MRHHHLLAVDVFQTIAFHLHQNPIDGRFEIRRAAEARTKGVAQRREAVVGKRGIRPRIDQLFNDRAPALRNRSRVQPRATRRCNHSENEKQKSFHENVHVAVRTRLLQWIQRSLFQQNEKRLILEIQWNRELREPREKSIQFASFAWFAVERNLLSLV